MCGPSSQQQATTTEQSNFYNQLANQYSTVFGQNQAITGALTNAFTPILQRGASQTGYSPAEETSLRTQADTGVATNYAQAQKATAQTLAAMGGGNTYIPSSVTANIMANTANQAAAQRSSQQLGITQANYERGYQNWLTAASGLSGVASQLSPTAYAGTATSAGSSAASSEAQMAQEAFSPYQAAFGTLGALGGAALKFA